LKLPVGSALPRGPGFAIDGIVQEQDRLSIASISVYKRSVEARSRRCKTSSIELLYLQYIIIYKSEYQRLVGINKHRELDLVIVELDIVNTELDLTIPKIYRGLDLKFGYLVIYTELV
jgi:hypothetical protein